MNSTRTWLTPPREPEYYVNTDHSCFKVEYAPVRPSTLVTFTSLTGIFEESIADDRGCAESWTSEDSVLNFFLFCGVCVGWRDYVAKIRETRRPNLERSSSSTEYGRLRFWTFSEFASRRKWSVQTGRFCCYLTFDCLLRPTALLEYRDLGKVAEAPALWHPNQTPRNRKWGDRQEEEGHRRWLSPTVGYIRLHDRWETGCRNYKEDQYGDTGNMEKVGSNWFP